MHRLPYPLTIPPHKIHEIFSATSYGKTLEKATRFHLYQPKEMSNEEWVELLGPDVNNLAHMPHTYDIMQHLISEIPYLNEKERITLGFVAITHDWAESIVGDIPGPLKTAEEDEEEIVVLRRLYPEVLGSEISNHFIEDVIAIMQDQSKGLGLIFNLVERFGYLQTGIRAWKKKQQPHRYIKKYDVLPIKLNWLCSSVLTHQTEKLLLYREHSTVLTTYLQDHAQIIWRMFCEIPEDAFDFYKEKKEEKRAQFLRHKELWEENYTTPHNTSLS